MTITIAALASGTGSNVTALADCILRGRVDARIGVVLSNNPDAPVLDFARSRGIAVWAKSHKDYATREAFDNAMLAVIDERVDAVVLAGYMRILSSVFIQRFAGKILNIHPALLPAFAGAHGVRDALAQGAKVTGCTVHFVDELLDHGPTIIQAAVPICDDDTESTLLPRIQAMEHRILPQAVQWLAQGRLSIQENRVRLLPREEKSTQPAQKTATNVAVQNNAHAFSKSGGSCLVSPPLEIFDDTAM